jgi:hypothetical protein
MTADGYLRGVLLDGARRFVYRSGVARLLGRVCADVDVVFVAAPACGAFPSLRPGTDTRREPTVRTYREDDLLPGYDEVLAAEPQRRTAAARPQSPPVPIAPPRDITHTSSAPRDRAAEDAVRAAAPGSAASIPTTIVVPASPTPTVSPQRSVTPITEHTRDDAVPLPAVTTPQADPGLPVDGPAIAPHAADPFADDHRQHVAEPPDVVRVAYAASPPVPRADGPPSGATPFSTDRLDEPDGEFVTARARRLSQRSVPARAATGIDTGTWSQAPEAPVEPARATPAALSPAAAEAVFLVDVRDAGGPPAFWARKHLCRLRPRLLR